MSRYFFDVHDQNGVHHDEIGDCFADLEEARAMAQSILPDIARRELPEGERQVVACDVRDEAGRVVYHCELVFQGVWAPA